MDKIKIHVPYIVKQEIDSQRGLEVKLEFNKLKKGLKNFKRQIPQAEELEDLIGKFESLEKSLIDNIESENSKYFEDLNAEFNKLDMNQTLRAWHAYFKGESPLTNVKNREDIPDSFVYQSILDIYEKNKIIEDKFIIIVDDNKILNSFKGDARFKVYRKLEDFFREPEIEKILNESYSAFKNQPFEFFIKNIEKNSSENLFLTFAFDDYISSNTTYFNFPYSNDNEALITSNLGLTDFDLDTESKSFSESTNEVIIDFTAKAFVQIEFYMDSFEYYSDDYLGVSLIEEVNRHVVLVEGQCDVFVKGKVSIEVSFDDEEINSLDEFHKNNENIKVYLSDKEIDAIFRIIDIDTVEYIYEKDNL